MKILIQFLNIIICTYCTKVSLKNYNLQLFDKVDKML